MDYLKYNYSIMTYITDELNLPLERGGRYVCCPLHNEDTPSFRIYEETDSFYCFGCLQGGDIIHLHKLLASKNKRILTYKQAKAEVEEIVSRKIGKKISSTGSFNMGQRKLKMVGGRVISTTPTEKLDKKSNLYAPIIKNQQETHENRITSGGVSTDNSQKNTNFSLNLDEKTEKEDYQSVFQLKKELGVGREEKSLNSLSQPNSPQTNVENPQTNVAENQTIAKTEDLGIENATISTEKGKVEDSHTKTTPPFSTEKESGDTHFSTETDTEKESGDTHFSTEKSSGNPPFSTETETKKENLANLPTNATNNATNLPTELPNLTKMEIVKLHKKAKAFNKDTEKEELIQTLTTLDLFSGKGKSKT